MPEIDKKAEQQEYVLFKLELCNWGSFHGIHTVMIPESGLLIVGESGTGKSTLLDAYSSLMTRPKWKSYNLASEGERYQRSKGRKDFDYIRGNLGRSEDDEGMPIVKYLREGPTFTLLSATFKNGLNQMVSLIQFFYIKGNSSESSQIKSHYFITENEFFLEKFNGFNFSAKDLKSKFPESKYQHFLNFNQYEACFCIKLGIRNKQLLRLLHAAQSTKSIKDVNEFIRTKMLINSNIKDIANSLLDEYEPLEAAYEKVIERSDQAELLNEVRKKHLRYLGVESKQIESEEIAEYIDAHKSSVLLAFYEKDIKAKETSFEILNEKIKTTRLELDSYQQKKERITLLRKKAGGHLLIELESDIKHLEIELDSRISKKNVFKKHLAVVKMELPTDGPGFIDLVNRIGGLINNSELELEKQNNFRDNLKQQENKVVELISNINSDFNLLKKQNANVTGQRAEVRQRISHNLKIELTDLPFVAELIEINDRGYSLTGILERLLYELGTSILVKKEDYEQVVKYVDKHNLNGEVEFYNIDDKSLVDGDKPYSNMVIECLNIKSGLFEQWVKNKLHKEFNHKLVDSVKEFINSKTPAITGSGLSKLTNGSHIKSDNWGIDESSKWILGFDNNSLLNDLSTQLNKNNTLLEDIKEEILETQVSQKSLVERVLTYNQILSSKWTEIDTQSVIENQQSLQNELEVIKNKSAKIKDLDSQLQLIEGVINPMVIQHDDNKNTLAVLKDRLEESHKEMSKARSELIDIPGGYLEKLTKLFAIKGSEKSISEINQKYQKAASSFLGSITENKIELNNLKNDIENKLSVFNQNWEALSLDLQLKADIDYVGEYLGVLDDIEKEGLNEFNKNFRDLMNQQTLSHLTDLFAEYEDAHAKNNERIQNVNNALKNTHYNHETFLQIYPKKLQVAPADEFRELIRNILSSSTSKDFNVVENRWLYTKELCEKLKCLTQEDKIWTKTALDVRLHYEYLAKEHETDGNMTVRKYHGLDLHDSGGEKEKLASTILASAIKYQMNDDCSTNMALKSVVLDEAFSKSDARFTYIALKTFMDLGFHMIIATPLKSVMVFESMLDGVLLIRKSNNMSFLEKFIQKHDDDYNFNLTAQESAD